MPVLDGSPTITGMTAVKLGEVLTLALILAAIAGAAPWAFWSLGSSTRRGDAGEPLRWRRSVGD